MKNMLKDFVCILQSIVSFLWW